MLKVTFLVSLCLLLTGCFPKQAGPRLSHFAIEAPQVGQPAPDFSLRNLAGETVTLTELLGDKPIVLQLGSHSCPVFRYRRFSMAKLYREYTEKAHFLLVYTLEAHPVGAINPYVDREWVSSFNYLTNTLIGEHKDIESRQAAAEYSTAELNIAYPTVIDNMHDEIWRAYGRAPSAAFVIDTQGTVAARMPWVDPEMIARALDSLTSQEE